VKSDRSRAKLISAGEAPEGDHHQRAFDHWPGRSKWPQLANVSVPYPGYVWINPALQGKV